MNALILLAQAFFNHQTSRQTENFKIAGLRAAEMGRRMAIAGVFFALAGIFFFSAILISLIDLGLQIDRGHGVSFSGLMISSVLICIIALFAVFGGWLCGRDPKAAAHVPPPPPSPAGELRPLLEAVAVGLLKEFLENQKSKSQPAATAPSAPTASNEKL